MNHFSSDLVCRIAIISDNPGPGLPFLVTVSSKP